MSDCLHGKLIGPGDNNYGRGYDAADPAQSAPSAERFVNGECVYCKEPQGEHHTHMCGYDRCKGELCEMWILRSTANRYQLCGDCLLARTAQLERERDANKVVMTTYFNGILKELGLPENQAVNLIYAVQELRTRAETAESALRQIVGNVDLKQLLEWLDFELSGSPGDGMLSDCKEIISRVAAQTPQQIANPGAGEKEER